MCDRDSLLDGSPSRPSLAVHCSLDSHLKLDVALAGVQRGSVDGVTDIAYADPYNKTHGNATLVGRPVIMKTLDVGSSIVPVSMRLLALACLFAAQLWSLVARMPLALPCIARSLMTLTSCTTVSPGWARRRVPVPARSCESPQALSALLPHSSPPSSLCTPCRVL